LADQYDAGGSDARDVDQQSRFTEFEGKVAAGGSAAQNAGAGLVDFLGRGAEFATVENSYHDTIEVGLGQGFAEDVKLHVRF
jgi:hypothetical protein